MPLLARARFGSLDALQPPGQDPRVRSAVAALTGFRPDQVVFQPNTSQGLMHVMFGITGGVALSPAEFPSLTFAVTRAAQALGVVEPVWLDTQPGRITPGGILDQDLPGVGRRRRGEPRRLPHRLSRGPRGHPSGDRRPHAHRRCDAGLRRRRCAVLARRRRRGRRPEMAKGRMGHRLPGAQRPGARSPHARVVGIQRDRRRGHADGRGAGSDPRTRQVLGEQPRPRRAGAPRRRARRDRLGRRPGDQRGASPARSAGSSTSPTSSGCR